MLFNTKNTKIKNGKKYVWEIGWTKPNDKCECILDGKYSIHMKIHSA